jgi:hypothetical protein
MCIMSGTWMVYDQIQRFTWNIANACVRYDQIRDAYV